MTLSTATAAFSARRRGRGTPAAHDPPLVGSDGAALDGPAEVTGADTNADARSVPGSGVDGVERAQPARTSARVSARQTRRALIKPDYLPDSYRVHMRGLSFPAVSATPSSGSPSSARPGRPWTVRVAAWSSRHRWPVALLWVVLTIGLFAASILAGGTKAVEAVSRDQGAKYESVEATQIFNDANANAGPQAPASQSVVVLVNNPGGTITDPASAAAVKDIVSRLTALQATVDG